MPLLIISNSIIESFQKPESFQGPYYHPICYKILKACFFGKSSDDGVAFSEFFAPIKPQTIALIFTAVSRSLCVSVSA